MSTAPKLSTRQGAAAAAATSAVAVSLWVRRRPDRRRGGGGAEEGRPTPRGPAASATRPRDRPHGGARTTAAAARRRPRHRGRCGWRGAAARAPSTASEPPRRRRLARSRRGTARWGDRRAQSRRPHTAVGRAADGHAGAPAARRRRARGRAAPLHARRAAPASSRRPSDDRDGARRCPLGGGVASSGAHSGVGRDRRPGRARGGSRRTAVRRLSLGRVGSPPPGADKTGVHPQVDHKSYFVSGRLGCAIVGHAPWWITPRTRSKARHARRFFRRGRAALPPPLRCHHHRPAVSVAMGECPC